MLYNVWLSRAEGMATAMEEWMTQAGLYDDSPRSCEIAAGEAGWLLRADKVVEY